MLIFNQPLKRGSSSNGSLLGCLTTRETMLVVKLMLVWSEKKIFHWLEIDFQVEEKRSQLAAYDSINGNRFFSVERLPQASEHKKIFCHLHLCFNWTSEADERHLVRSSEVSQVLRRKSNREQIKKKLKRNASEKWREKWREIVFVPIRVERIESYLCSLRSPFPLIIQ